MRSRESKKEKKDEDTIEGLSVRQKDGTAMRLLFVFFKAEVVLTVIRSC